MSTVTTDTYRSRIYNHYVQAREQALAPESVAGLAPRSHALRRLIEQHFPADRNSTVLDLGCGHGALLPFDDDVLRVLKPGGRWIIHVPNGESPFGGRMRYWDLTHELAFTRTSVAQLLLASGFSDVRCFEDQPVVHGAKSALRWLLWQGFRALLRLYIHRRRDGRRQQWAYLFPEPARRGTQVNVSAR